MSVSVVATVKDEARSIEAFLASLAAQTRRPDEVVVVDGGSADGTPALVRALADGLPLRLLEAPGTNIAQGRNLAVARAAGEIVAVADAGTVLDPGWLEHLVAPLESDPGVGVSAGFFRPGGATLLERCLATVTIPHRAEIDPARFLPSSRSVAFRREWWERAGGYPEWLRHCEDLVFDLDLRRLGAVFAFAPRAEVAWSARSTLPAFFRQYFAYARGDGHAGLWPRRHAVRYGAYAAGLALAALARRSPAAAVPLAAGAAVHLGKYYRRLFRRLPARSAAGIAACVALVPAIVVTGDVAKMLGYPVGLRERRRVRPGGRA